MRTSTCTSLNLTLPKGGKGFQGAGALVRRLGALLGGFPAACHGTIKCNFTAAPQAGKDGFLCLFKINFIKHLYDYIFFH